MGNLQKWMGPPSVQWMQNQRQLAVQILDRMEELWMEPVLPAFAGFLPAEFSEKYPNSQTQQLSTWSHFNCSYSCITWLEPQGKFSITLHKLFKAKEKTTIRKFRRSNV